MDRLDSSNFVLSWKYEPFFVMYLDGTKVKKYIPDFFIETTDGRKLIVEIKPERLRSGTTNSSKRNAITQKCTEECWEYYEWSPECEILP